MKIKEAVMINKAKELIRLWAGQARVFEELANMGVSEVSMRREYSEAMGKCFGVRQFVGLGEEFDEERIEGAEEAVAFIRLHRGDLVALLDYVGFDGKVYMDYMGDAGFPIG